VSAPHLVLLCPDRVYTPRNPPPPPAPTVAVRLVRDAASPSGWSRKRIGAPEVELARRGGVPVLVSWDQLDLVSGLYDELGVVVLDPVQR
jgi:hypothetical protein